MKNRPADTPAAPQTFDLARDPDVQTSAPDVEAPPTGKQPAEVWAKLLGHYDPTPTRERPAFAFSEYRAWMYEAAKVQWGHDDKGVWRPGAIGKEMTREEYEVFVQKALDARATGTGEPPPPAKKEQSDG